MPAYAYILYIETPSCLAEYDKPVSVIQTSLAIVAELLET